GCENLKTLHLNLIQRKNRSYPTLETVPCSLFPVPCLHDKTFSATPKYLKEALEIKSRLLGNLCN
ncbi:MULTISPECIES: hypothetical protein, partial [Cyanophyceae]|uniref:hypothetical protein n=1 Tax=Cyanophyceae TaxID=3028117 RepID=UPI00232E9F9E